MNIGILTYYRVANFGANLQAVSTYYYLKNNGYNPLFILYESDDTVKNFQKKQANEIQKEEHVHFVDTVIPNQSFRCFNANDINRAINEYNLDASPSYSYVSSFPLPARYSPGWDGRNRCRPDAPVCLPPTPRPWHVTAHRARLPHPFQSTYNVSEYGHGAGPCSPFRSAGDAGATYSLPLVAQVIWDSRTNQIVLPYCSFFIDESSISVNHGRD